jgi:hypothetical protein
VVVAEDAALAGEGCSSPRYVSTPSAASASSDPASSTTSGRSPTASATRSASCSGAEPCGQRSVTRNGRRSKTVLTEVGPVEIDVPRDRDGSFEPKIVAKRQRRLSGVDELVISLSAKGLTTGEVQAHLAEVYGAEVSRQTISTITDKVIEGMAEWGEPAAGPGLSGGVHRRDQHEDPRREGR